MTATSSLSSVRRLAALLGAVAAIGVVAACGDDGAGAPSSTVPTTVPTSSSVASPPTEGAAAARCVDSGGTVETRHPYLNTNLDQSSWVRLPGELELCRFESDDADASRLYIDTTSLAATTASLADAAYLAKLPVPSTDGANPATMGCIDNVGGAATFGTAVNGGGWVDMDDPVFTVVDMCVFADGSAIDQWAITYYAGGITRGIDLAPLFRFDTDAAAGLFPTPINT